MKPQYVFSLAAFSATVAIVWPRSAPTPVTSTRVEEGLVVQITKHAPPHRFEELPVPPLANPPQNVFLMPKSYLRERLCAGDEAVVAAAQARMLITPGEGRELGNLVSGCGETSPLCPKAEAAFREDAGLNADELRFFADALLGCDWQRGAELRNDLRLPLEIREQAWSFFVDGGSWSPELGALVEEHLATYGRSENFSHFRLATILGAISTESPELLDASVQLMDRVPSMSNLFRQARAPSVREAACARSGCDAGVLDVSGSGVDQHEELAACVLQGPRHRQARCLDDLAGIDWSMARSVADRTDQYSEWRASLRTFETRQAFDEFARSFGAATETDGGFRPELLLGGYTPESIFDLYAVDGLGTDELAARWAALSPELKGAFFFESDDGAGGLRLSGRISDEQYEVSVRREKETVDPRAALALLNTMAAERGSPRRFVLVKSIWSPLARFVEPERVTKLVELEIVERLDPEKVRAFEE